MEYHNTRDSKYDWTWYEWLIAILCLPFLVIFCLVLGITCSAIALFEYFIHPPKP